MPAKGAMSSPTRTPPASVTLEKQPAVDLDGVRRVFAAGSVVALDGVSLRVDPGAVVAVVGPSGCGKSTLLDLVCGLQAPDAGTVRSPAPAARGAATGAVLMPQGDTLLPWASALDNAALALRIAGVARPAARERARVELEALGLGQFADARPAALSGGMRQRIAVARTLLSGAGVICLDEPFGALDAITRADAQRWLTATLAREPRTVLLVTHDTEEAALLADRVVVLSARPGRVVADIPVPLPHPRVATDAAVVAVRAEVLAALEAGR
ncbi:Bicarbonate transport ATP-binding protein CmpC [Paraconexibacter sp. AEG42_29]|uniref:Bicarbonate transport ATP-binding protein CmpC n=1 Tax=Paraconexibacter sp. AEG42_29 TaxID=2997339 RepID=A0AAU7ASR8_9ACTN